jgi:hypothetical protein
MRRTCNKDLINPEYKSTQQDLTDEKGGEDSGMQAQGIQGKVLVRIKVLLQKNLLIVYHCFQSFKLIIYYGY